MSALRKKKKTEIKVGDLWWSRGNKCLVLIVAKGDGEMIATYYFERNPDKELYWQPVDHLEGHIEGRRWIDPLEYWEDLKNNP